MKKLSAPLLLTLVTLLFGGCISNAVISQGLRAELVRLERTAGGDLQVTWRFRNPNVVPYVINRSVLKISLDGKPIGELTGIKRFGVPAQNLFEQTSVLPASAVTDAATVQQALARGSASYNLGATMWILLVDDKEEKFHVDTAGTVALGAP